ncbi:MAG: CDP-alcohol phosphatidyltransferase family protein [Eubacteriales bacterium]|nr:CDP-alcohol phosphatidyltransferase family protein [Eubacteriales bacterium]
MVGFWNYTVYLTYCGLVSAVSGIYYAFTGRIKASLICLLISGVCDMFDGRIARTKKDRTEAEKSFGIQIDSLCDVVCFGILPAVLSFALGTERVWQTVVAALFALCGVIRLAYFNVMAQEEHSSGYLGIPITTSALAVPLLMCFRNVLGDKLPIAYSILLAVMGVLYIAPIRVKKPGRLGSAVMIVIGVAVLICIIIKM